MKLRSITSPSVVLPAIAIGAAALIILSVFSMAVSGDIETVSKNRVEWEEVSSSFSSHVYRTRVPSGWLVKTNAGKAITFVPDPEHKWLKKDI
jgi:hypothetical protein